MPYPKGSLQLHNYSLGLEILLKVLDAHGALKNVLQITSHSGSRWGDQQLLCRPGAQPHDPP